MLIDLHTHSTFSDGLLTVEQLVKKAKRRGVKMLALTDHDTIGGWALFAKICGKYGIMGVRGLEMSTDLQGLELHILGYEPIKNHRPLIEHLKQQQTKRIERAKVVLVKLEQLGLKFKPEIVRHLLQQPTVGKPQLGRAVLHERHNRLLLKKLFNFEGSLSDFINNFLDKPGQVGYVRKKRIASVKAIRLIKSCGGKAVLAHPDLEMPNAEDAKKIMKTLASADLWGMENPHYHPSRAKYLLPLAKKYNLAITHGSDTHDGKKMGISINELEFKKIYAGIFRHC
ncbi:MAG: PHP domain-containing protein [Candidatus Magasanikbacteria bacterium]|nr:PHP domain-containing protein [Candidatus Magasanikbacteria bacterium]